MPAVYAIVNATIVPAPGQRIEKGTILFRDGVIVSVGADVAIPDDARQIDLAGRTVYAGFIDAYARLPADASKADPALAELLGAKHWNARIVPQVDASRIWKRDDEAMKKLRSQGVVAQHLAPSFGIVKGSGVIVTTGTKPQNDSIVRGRVGQNVAFHLRGRNFDGYPTSPMGAYALIRQTWMDADWSIAARKAIATQPSLGAIESNDALDAIAADRSGAVFVEAPDELYATRARTLASELKWNLVTVGGGFEYRLAAEIGKDGATVILPVNFPKPPDVSSPALQRAVTLEQLQHWDLAPESPARLVRAGAKVSLATDGLKDVGTFLDRVRTSVERGLSEDDALAALTTTPAATLSVDATLGTIAPGKRASFVVADGPVFDRKAKLAETWVDGERFEFGYRDGLDVRGTYRVALDNRTFDLSLAGEAGAPRVSIKQTEPEQVDSATTSPATKPAPASARNVSLVDTQLSFVIDGKLVGTDGAAVASISLVAKPSGYVVLSDGTRKPITVERTGNASSATQPASKPATKPTTRASFEPSYPLGAYGRNGLPERQGYLITNATVWTCGEQGVLQNAYVLVDAEGHVSKVGTDKWYEAAKLSVPVIDGTGLHVTPGMIDCHAHIATDGGINESGQAISAEVRIGDFMDPTDISIYRQLAGGLTTANILHGSANPIGGQNQVIKLRWGARPDELKFDGAPPGIKFALGENVKQSNWGDRFTTRYPQTRMGTEQIMRDEFRAARDYAAAWKKWNDTSEGIPPRRDLELDAIVEVVTGTRFVHCHAYRQDEMLALMRTAEELGFRIRTFQHALEAYKIAPEVAKHGAGASNFADWWAIKVELFDAIPYSPGILTRAGVLTSVNSDDPELARRMNLEAAKSVKYGRMTPIDALKLVTINPAKQLGIDARVGSIEVGKDADLVLWTGDPLSVYSRVEKTWIDGRLMWSRDDDLAAQKRNDEMRRTLIQKILTSGETPGRPDEMPKREGERWPRVDVFCVHEQK